jgi:hypothetical protein
MGLICKQRDTSYYFTARKQIEFDIFRLSSVCNIKILILHRKNGEKIAEMKLLVVCLRVCCCSTVDEERRRNKPLRI